MWIAFLYFNSLTSIMGGNSTYSTRTLNPNGIIKEKSHRSLRQEAGGIRMVHA